MGLLEIADLDHAPGRVAVSAERARWCCERLERGDILVMPRWAVVDDADRRFLTQVRQAGSAFIKNVSYEPRSGKLRGFSSGTDAVRLKRALCTYSERIRSAAAQLLAPYAAGMEVDFTSFRPIEERGRNLTGRSRNDLIHVDSFPTRPARGRRILRFFTNIHPAQPRIWVTSTTFDELAPRMAQEAGLIKYASPSGALGRIAQAFARGRTPYDRFMLRFHDYLKGNRAFQCGCVRYRHQFPAGSTWVVFTDMVPHAVESGQYALEQTFFVAVDSMLTPARSPLRILESIAGVAMV